MNPNLIELVDLVASIIDDGSIYTDVLIGWNGSRHVESLQLIFNSYIDGSTIKQLSQVVNINSIQSQPGILTMEVEARQKLVDEEQ